MRIQEGMVVRTSYGTGPYRILDVEQHCTCPSFSDAITLLDKAPASRPHAHCTCRKVGETFGFYYLNGYDENLINVWDENSRLIVCHEETTLLTLICNGL